MPLISGSNLALAGGTLSGSLTVSPATAITGLTVSDVTAVKTSFDRVVFAATMWNPPAAGRLDVVRATVTGKGVSNDTHGGVAFRSVAKDHTSVANVAVTGAANNGAGLIRITATAHGYTTGDEINIYGIVGTTEANASWTITVIDANTFDLQASTFANAYVSGGTSTNRPCIYAHLAEVNLTVARGGASVANADDVAGYTVQNISGGSLVSGDRQATDAFYLAASPGIVGPAWYSGFNVGADLLYAFRAGGTIEGAGLDLYPATFTGGAPAIRLPNNVSISARNAANSADVAMIKLTASPANHVQIQTTLNLADGVSVVLGTGTGTIWGSATAQKQAWWGATPVVQQVLATGAGHTVDNVITLLQTLGLCKQA